jgi:hypothetical protein
MSGGSIWASLECQCSFWIAGGLVSYLTEYTHPPAIQKQQWHSRKAQIEPPLIECDCECSECGWAFRIRFHL